MSAITATRVDEVLQRAVESGTVPNVVATATSAEGSIYEGAFGPKAVGKPEPVTVDTLYRIASMTKMVATVAALQLVEQGKLDLDAPVSDYRPEFADLKVLDGWDGDTPRLRDPASQATIRQLASHSSGLNYWFWNADIVRWEALTGTGNTLSGKADAFTAPLVADPGTKVEYGTNTDWLGLVVEAVSGAKLDAYFDEHILQPLGMAHATFHPASSSARTSLPCTCAARRAANGRPPTWTGTPRPTGGRAGMACTARRATISLPAHAAQPRHA